MGFTVAVNPSTGAVTQFCNLLPGVASWQCTSDRNAKENFEPANTGEILERLVAMPMSSWNFKRGNPRLRLLGPMAQDFYEAFHLGNDNLTIISTNLHGVALAAIQGLNAKLEERIAEQQHDIAELRRMLLELRSAMEVKAAMH